MRVIGFIATGTLALALACFDSTDPGGVGDNPIALQTCDPMGIAWYAYQNEGGAWTRVEPDANGELHIEATDKVSIAVAASFFGTSFTQVINATAAELQDTPEVSCDESLDGRTMSGTVVGVTGTMSARVSAAASAAFVDGFNTSWLLENLPARPVDVIATRYSTFSTLAERVVVRRDVTPMNGSIPAIDLAGPGSATMEDRLVTVLAIPANSQYVVSSSVTTSNGTLHELGEVADATTTAASATLGYGSLPAALRVATDLHALVASAFETQGQRYITHYYRTPETLSLTFGPMVSAPATGTVATTPYVRPRAQVASQAEYPGAILVEWSESSEASSTFFGVMTTMAFAGGTPQTWDVVVPDLTSAGYTSAWGLKTTTSEWSVSAFSATGPGLLGGAVADATLRSATRGALPTVMFGKSPRNRPQSVFARAHKLMLQRAGTK